MILSSIQYLRGVAALMVVVFHVLDSAGRFDAPVTLPSFSIGEAGVDLFFVISGFIIWLSTAGKAVTATTFLAKRVRRIVPLYWALTVLMVLVALFLPSLLNSTVFDGAHVLASFFFWPYPHPTLGVPNPVLFVGWTLNYEMAFYVVFALLLGRASRTRAGVFVAGSLLIVAIGRIFQPSGALAFYTDPIILEFSFGILIGALYTSGLKPGRGVGIAAIVLGIAALALLSNAPVHRVVSYGLPMALVVFGAAFLETSRHERDLRLPLLVGNASYSIYLTHILALPVIQIVWREALGTPSSGGEIFLYAAGASAACLVGGIVTYWIVERPLNTLASRAMAVGAPRVARLAARS